MADKEPGPMVCRYCGKVYRSRSGLNDHERRHNNKAPFRCCGKRFYSRTNLFRHRCNVHGRPKEYECDVCNSKFGTVAELNVHNKRVHQEDTHKCDTCGKSFTTCSALKDHTDTHTGAKRHVCQCGKAYRYATGLSRHKKQCDAAKNG